MSSRVERLRGELERAGAATFLVSDVVNVRYLTGLESSNAVLLVGRDRLVLATDGRYAEAARAVPDLEVVEADRELPPWLGPRLPDLAEPPVAFEADHVTVAAHEHLAASGLELVATAGVVKRLRAVKDDTELEAVGRAARILTDALARFLRDGLAGKTEAEAAWSLEQTIHEEGADEVAFPVIVASGPNAALPHHHPGARKIGRGETVIVDAGARVDGYCSDCTRTVATGPLPPELRRAYAVCRSAQEAALAGVRAGAGASAVDGMARREIREAGIDVLHGLGHGVGLEVHELPRLTDTSEEMLAAGNVVTVEPGVYLPGAGGVRIEDLVVVSEAGAQVLTPVTKDLLTLDQ